MTDIFKPDFLGIFLLLAVPGIVTVKVYDLLVPTNRANAKEWIFEAVGYGALNLSLLSWPVHIASEPGFRERHDGLYHLIMLGVMFVMPALLAVAVRRLRTLPCLRGRSIHPIPTAWDYFFGSGQPCFVLFHHKAGKIGGYYGGRSFASSFPNENEVYVEQVWRVDGEGRFTEPVVGSLGATIARDDCTLIEFFSAKEADGDGK